jgi:hypothetical protein
MVLTKDEVEAKLAALEDRISLLARVTDNLELRFDEGAERWDEWVSETRNAIVCLRRQLDHLREQLPLPRR